MDIENIFPQSQESKETDNAKGRQLCFLSTILNIKTQKRNLKKIKAKFKL